MFLTTRRGPSAKVCLGVISACLLICACIFLRAVSSRSSVAQPATIRSASQRLPDALQPIQSTSVTIERQRFEKEEAHAFYLAKRAPGGKATPGSAASFGESYLAARQRMCLMAGYSTALDQPLPSSTRMAGENDGGGWSSLGPGSNAGDVMKEIADPCAPGGAAHWPEPQFEFGATLFTHGQAYPGGTAYLGGALDRGILRGDEGGSWAVLKGAPGQVAIDPSDPNVLYVAGPGLRLRKSSDGGRAFNDVTEGLADEGLLVAPLALDPNDNQRLWLGGRAVWRTTDGAERWTRASAPVSGGPDARVSALAVAATNSGFALAGTNTGDIHRAFDSFNVTPDEQWPSVRPRAGFVSSLTFDPHNPNLAYATYSTLGGAHVWRSYDAGASWASIDGAGATALPDTPAHSLVVDPTNPARLYVGTDLGVFVSLDGGQNWAVERTGFGTAIVESLALGATNSGPALFAFTHGRGVWRVALAPEQCNYTIAPSRDAFEAAGGAGHVEVTTAANCNWTAASNATWVTINSGSSGSGPGAVNFTVAANTSNSARSATLTIAGRAFTVEQGGVGGTCAIMPIQSGQIINGALSAGDCLSQTRASTPTSPYYADRHSFTAAAGELVSISLTSTFSPELSLIGPNNTVVARGAGFSSEPARIPSSGAFFTLPASGTYLIEASSSFSGATGAYTLTFARAPAGCNAYSLLPARQSFDPGGGDGRIQVATSSNCPWAAASSVAWVSIAMGGGGSTEIVYRVDPNSGPYRTGTLVVAGQTFTVEQAGAGGSCLPNQIDAGQTVRGALSAADCRSRRSVPGGTYYTDRYAFTATAGQQVIVPASATGFTPYFYLIGPDGSPLAQGAQRMPPGSGSFAVPADGSYMIEITSETAAGAGDYAFTLTILPPGCGYAIAPTGQAFEAAGGTGSVSVTAGGDCPWTAASNASWIMLASPANNTGNGTVNFTVAANTGDDARRGALSVAGRVFTVDQAGAAGRCLAGEIAPGQSVSSVLSRADCQSRVRTGNFAGAVFYAERYSFDATAGQQVQLRASAGSFAPYLYLFAPDGSALAEGRAPAPSGATSLILPASGSYTVEVTSEIAQSEGLFTLSLNLTPGGCGYLVSPLAQRIEAGGGAGSVSVTAAPGCAWTARSDASWLQFTSGAVGSGSGTVNFSVAANNSTVLRRATLQVAGQTVIVEQAGAGGNCAPQAITPRQTVSESLSGADCRSPLRTDFSGGGLFYADRYSFSAAAGERLEITISFANFDPYLYLLDASGRVLAQGRGSRLPETGGFVAPAGGTYLVEVTSNFSGVTGSYTLNLNVTPGSCSFAIDSISQTFESAGGTGSVSVMAPNGCGWTATSNASWLQITSAASGTGNGTINFTVAPNTGVLRSGALTVAGIVFTVEQAGAGGSCATQAASLGETVNGGLSAADCRSRLRITSTFYADRYSFNFTAGQQLAINVTSSSFAPYLYLTNADGVILAESAASQGAARLPAGTGFLTLPASGVYFIEVTSSNALSAGSYTLSLSAPTGCAYSLTLARGRFESGGGPGRLGVVAGNACAWTATSDVAWITFPTGASGVGNGEINFAVAANTSGNVRSGSITLGGQSFLVEQAGAGGSCAVQMISPGQTVSARITTADCRGSMDFSSAIEYSDRYSFSAQAGDRIAILTTRTISFFEPRLFLFDPRGALLRSNDFRLPSSGFLTLPVSGIYTLEASETDTGDYTLTLLRLPGGCNYDIAPTGQSLEFAGGEGSFNLTAGDGCPWQIISTANWITLAAGSGSGTGNATIRFTVANNNTPTARSGALLVGDRSFLVEQAGVGGSCVVAPLVPGQVASGSLTEGDCLSRTTTESVRADRYSFSGEAGQQIALSAVGGFTPTLAVTSPDGTVIARLEGTRLPASGLLSLPASGAYIVEVALPRFGVPSDRSYQLVLSVTPAGCSYALDAARQGFDPGGGSASVRVTAGAGCSWLAVSTANWVTINSGASGAGSGAVGFTVAANTSVAPRSARLLIAGQAFLIEQAGAGGNCAVTPLAPGQAVAGALSQADCRSLTKPTGGTFYGDRYSFTAAAGQQALITVASSAFPPAVYLSDANGRALAGDDGAFGRDARIPNGSGFFTLPGAGTYFIEVVASSSFSSAVGAYTLALTLAPTACSYGITPTTRAIDGAGSGSVRVITSQGCSWTAASGAPWMAITSGTSGTGNGEITYTVAANDGGQPRTGMLTIAGQTFNVRQAGRNGNCVPQPIMPGQTVQGTLSVADCPSRLRQDRPPSADRFTFTGTAGERVAIMATTQIGTGPVFLALFDPGGALLAETDTLRLPRGLGVFLLPASGLYTIEISSFVSGNYALTLSQQAPCSFAVTPTALTIESAGGVGRVAVTAAGGCDWNAVASMVDWITFPPGANFGSGDGELRFQVTANPNATPRTGALIVAGRIARVTQAGRVTLASAASFNTAELAPDSIAAAFGQDLATGVAVANTTPLPLTLAGTTVKVRDSAGVTRDARLFAVAPSQVNFLAPEETALGEATVIVASGSGNVTTGVTQIAAIAPGLFAANADGRGVAAGVALRVRNGVQSYEPLARFDPMANRFVAAPIDLGAEGDQVYLILFGTGFRARSALAGATAQVGGVSAPVLFAGPQGNLAGLDQANIALPRSLAGRGEINVTLTVDGKATNSVQIVIR